MSSESIDDRTLERMIKFYILICLQIPSVCCSIFILYHFKWSRLHNQIYGFLIIVNGLIVSIELPITLLFLHNGHIPSEKMCSSWLVLNYSIFVSSISLMAWTSIERYLFIYHERLVVQHSYLLHYFPICCLNIYIVIFYLYAIVWYPCKNSYDTTKYVCGGACYQYEFTLGLFDYIGNVLNTVLITLIMNIIIIIRHLIQKYRMRHALHSSARSHQWRRSFRLIIQLIAASMLYIIGWIPYITIGLFQIFENTPQLAFLLSTIFVYIPYIQTLLLPIICLLFMPDLLQKFRRLFQTKNRIHISK